VNDITTRDDVTRLIRRFYDRLLLDEQVKHIFEPLNLDEHLPKVIHFWCFVLLDEEGYRTNVFEKHLPLPLKPGHFDVWLAHFTSSVDELFKGEIADMAKQRATVLVFTFKNKWASLGRN
jgi:hemoglobin